MTNIKEKYCKKLLVEGNDDQHVIWALCDRRQITGAFDVVDCEGINNLLRQFPIRLKLPTDKINTLGIIVDADIDLKNRWDSIRNILQNNGFAVPDKLPSEGLIITHPENGKKVGVWIMPNNNLNGMLEDFITFLIPQDDKLLPVVDETLKRIERDRLNHCKHQSKVKIYTWLAWQEEPGKPLGQSITMKYLTTDEETCLKLMDWLKKLFSDG
ncbi:MAG: hypothetical protein LBQ54_05765 [Planctomycetaceae bacterium]|jgi:hypothetical protein|nr:hypothetical protein [Planctomycetaceae bacterium]